MLDYIWVLSNGNSTLPASEISNLAYPNGEFDNNMIRSGIMMFFDPQTKKQLEKEIRAQFEAFKKTGLTLDHVNAHKHFHLHPTIFDLILEIGKDYGLTAVRIPNEPVLPSLFDSTKEKLQRYALRLFLSPFISRMKRKCEINNIIYNDTVYGLFDSGHMNIDKLVRIIPHVSNGITEIYSHPATERWDNIESEAADYEFEAEYNALIHARTKRTVEKFDIELTGFNG